MGLITQAFCLKMKNKKCVNENETISCQYALMPLGMMFDFLVNARLSASKPGFKSCCYLQESLVAPERATSQN